MDNRKFLGIYGILICFTMRKVIFNKDYLTILRENLQDMQNTSILNGTKIVDSNGKPLTVYRAQRDNRIQGVDRQSNHKGIYFSADRESTTKYGNIIKSYNLNIKNPLILKDKEWNLSVIPDYYYQLLIKKGYDGAIWLRNGIMYEIVAFYAEQVIPIASDDNVTENLEMEVSANDINLNPLEPKPQLNPKFWINGKLNSKVRLKLMDIADDFIQTLNVKWVKPLDVVFTGSLANYNWTKYSDIDIYVIMNYEEVYKNVEFVKEYFEMKKYSWTQDHDSLRIYGFPVELYVEDSNDAASSSGVYSIERNKWIVEPKPFDDNEFDEQYVKKTAAKLMTQVDELSDMIDSTDDEYKMDVLSKKVKRLNDKVKFIRQKSLKKDGEMGNGNIIYKAMRNAGYIDKLWDLKSKTYDKLNSLK